MLPLPDKEVSYWRADVTLPVYPPLRENTEVDVAIVGGGITGLTTAYLLKQAGLSVAVIEKDTIGSGTTGHTTGKVTSQHNLMYAELEQRLGTETARLYGQANQTALEKIADIIAKEEINCEWQPADNYVFTGQPGLVRQFRHEAETAIRLGLPASFEARIALPLTVRAAVKFVNQGRLNAQQYILGLAAAVDGNGSHVFEQSRVLAIHDGTSCRIRSARAAVRARNVVVATNVPTFPLLARAGYCLLEYPHMSYIVAGEPEEAVTGMYISPDEDNYSILPVSSQGENLLFIGGENHIPGLGGGARRHYQRLAAYAHEHFGVSSIAYHWSARDYMAYDGLPLVGKVYPWSKHLYTATAFKKWGLTNTMVAAMILRDLIIAEPNPWAPVFDSLRKGPVQSIPRVITGST